MSEYRAPLEDFRFLIQQVFDLPSFWSTLTGAESVDEDTINAILEEGAKLCEQVIAPLNTGADEQGCRWDNGQVIVPDGFHEAYTLFCEGGWGALAGDSEYGGMQLPKSFVSFFEEMVQGASISFGLAPMLTSGAALAIHAHANETLKALYLPKMYSGEWSGAMDLTEPHCGTDLGLIRTKAEPNDDGSYAITGTKIFITWGEHDMADNIVHLVLAKLPDAPAGRRGISMFLVPKFLLDEHGDVGQKNAFSCGSIEKKMGIKGSATCVMNYDGATGWLVGEANKGLAAMFTMMNYERLVVGIQGLAVAENSYQGACAYAQDRLQGRSALGPVNQSGDADPLWVHPDVRRMLLSMRALTQGGRALYVYTAQFLDGVKYGSEQDDKSKAETMVAFLTPIVKAFLTDRAFDSCVLGQQVLGGHGFIREWGQEQHVRDVRITQIYEGTNGIQAMDLIGRKLLGSKGEIVAPLFDDIMSTITLVDSGSVFYEYARHLNDEVVRARNLIATIISNASVKPNYAGAIAVDFQDYMGYLCLGYMWLKMLHAIETRDDDFAQSKKITGQYYFERLFPRCASLYQAMVNESGVMMDLDDEQWFL